MNILDRVGKSPVLPILNLVDIQQALRAAEALANGGIETIEITLRNKKALTVLQEIRKEFPHFTLGAGTILREEQIKQILDIGVDFGVAPGWNESVWEKAQLNKFMLIPGIITPTELNNAHQKGCTTLKIFPIESVGGYPYMHALLAPFRNLGIKYIPTGGIKEKAVPSYLADPDVLTVGGSWLTPANLLENSQFVEITKLAMKAVSLAKCTT